MVDAFALDSPAETLPLQVNTDRDYPEETRLKYRFLDLRREKMQRNIVLRSQVIASIRRHMHEQGFTEFQTPILTASSPEGARDFLVPSRLHPGRFYALPQAPQQYKQLYMISGFDRYFQIAPCFRDEDARADRSPGEFYQLDIEMSFVTQEDVFAAVEPVMHGLFTEFSDWEVTPTPFPRITFADALLRYGTDKPDLRNPVQIADVTEVFRGSGFKVFAGAVERGAVVRAVPAPGAVGRPRSFFDQMVAFAQSLGAPGLGWVALADGEAKGPIAKFLDAERMAALRLAAGLADGDAVFFVCDQPGPAAKLAGQVRTRVGEELGLIAQRCYRFCWIVDFPMYEWDEEAKAVTFSHNPFSMPQGGMEALAEPGSADDPGLPVRHRLQRDRAELGSDPQPSPRHHGQGVRARRLWARGAGGEVRRHVPRPAVRGAAAWRHRPGRGPDRHAAGGHAEPARGDGVSAVAAGGGAASGCAGDGRREAAQGAEHPALAGRAGEAAGRGGARPPAPSRRRGGQLAWRCTSERMPRRSSEARSRKTRMRASP